MSASARCSVTSSYTDATTATGRRKTLKTTIMEYEDYVIDKPPAISRGPFTRINRK